MAQRHPNAAFWGVFFLLNGLLFLPIFWFFRADASFWPWSGAAGDGAGALVAGIFLQRANPDIFRLNVELLALVLAWVFLPFVRKRWFLVAAFLLYLAQLVYAAYEGFIRSYYLLAPVFYNDFFLFADGTRYVLRNLSVSPLLAVGIGGLLALLAGLLFALHRLLFGHVRPERLSRATRLGLTGLALLALTPLLVFEGKIDAPETAVTSFAAKISHNIQLSRLAKAEADRFDTAALAPFYQFTDADLQQKPDVYLIFLESYGSVLTKRPDFRVQYRLLLDSITFRLDRHDWAAASANSISPTWGGGSWLAYTSALTGLRLDTHAQYLALFNRYQQEPFPHLFNYLHSQGYRSYWISSNSENLNEIEWQRYKDFYGVDEWLRFEDMGYDGPLYGWGPSPPDQYVLNFAHDVMNKTEDPHLFFYITQNSHYPWTPLPEISASWKMLTDTPALAPASSQTMDVEVMRQQYLASIEYELTMLVDFINTRADEGDIFVLIGDHQPARVARYQDGWDTPIHIISKDSAFVEAFYEYGFAPGMKAPVGAATLHHEGFYSLFMRVFLQEYGHDPAHLPEYMPEGIPLD